MSNLIKLKPVNKVQDIICKFCYTIGMIPTSYKLGLTVEEQILAIGRYLEETVIPALNNNAEAVVELQNLFIELKNYVENYFDNLDVQDEINIKLDAMLQDGELQSIILEYLKLNSMLIFDTVEAMKASQNVVNGSYVKTLGYFTKNDNGSAIYKISNSISDTDVYVTLQNNLYAILQIENTMNVKQFGVKGDAVTNENDLIASILNNTNIHKLIFNESESYLVNNFNLTSNKILDFNGSTVIINLAEGKFRLQNIENVKIFNVHVKSNIDRDTFTADPNLSLVYVASSKNIKLKNVIVDYAITDGIILARPNGSSHNENIYIENCKVLNPGRNGFAITDGKNVYVSKCEFSNAIKWNPRFGIDLEPNFIDDKLENIHINNCLTQNNGYGSLSFSTLRTATDISIYVNDIISKNDNINGSYNIIFSNDHTREIMNTTHNEGIISINNFQSYNCHGYPIGIYGNKSDEVKFIVDNSEFNCKNVQIQWHGTAISTDILGNAFIRAKFNKLTGFQYNCDNFNTGYKNIFLQNEEYSIPAENQSSSSGTSTFENVKLAQITSYTASNIKTMIYDGVNNTVINKYGSITVTKQDTGIYKIESLSRGAWIMSQNGYNIALDTNGTIQVKNNGVLTDDVIFIMQTAPAYVGEIEYMSSIS